MLDIEALVTGMQSLTNTQLKQILNISQYRLNKYLDELESRSIITLVRKCPKTYQIEDMFLQEIFN